MKLGSTWIDLDLFISSLLGSVILVCKEYSFLRSQIKYLVIFIIHIRNITHLLGVNPLPLGN